MRPWTATLAIVLGLGATAAPALADDDQPTVVFDQRVTEEFQSWNWVGAANTGSLSFNTPMTVFTITDHSGALFGAAMNVAKNESNRREAEREAIKKDKYYYTYAVEEAKPAEGTRFSFSVGMGGINGASGTSTTADSNAKGFAAASGVQMHFAKLGLEADIVELLGGVLVFDTGIANWSADAPNANGGATVHLGAFDWPLGLHWRFAPRFLPGLVIEPSASFDWLYTAGMAANGTGARWNAYDLGVEVGYHILPGVKLRASYTLNSLAHDKVSWMKDDETVSMKNAAAGVTMLF